jgi:LysM repeat protein
MELSLRVSDEYACSDSQSTVGGAEATSREPVLTTAVGASYAFDPGVDGLASIYAARVLERGVDPRGLCAEIRADRLGLVARGPQRRALLARTRTSRFGRGTAAHLQLRISENEPSRAIVSAREKRPDGSAKLRQGIQLGFSRKLAAAGLAVLLLLPLGIIVAHAQDAPLQSRYVVQPGDSLDGVAAEFGVDPAAILAASAIENPPSLTPSEIIVIPDPGESPEAAAWNASQQEGTSPFVAGARGVEPGETLAGIAAEYGLDPWALAAFNGLADIDALHAGQRLRIPLTDTAVDPAVQAMTDSAPIEPAPETAESWVDGDGWSEEAQWTPEAVHGPDPG